MSTVSPPNSSPSSRLSADASGIGSLTCLDSKALWRSTAPAAVRDAWKQDNHAAAWEAWTKHLAKRKRPATALTSDGKRSNGSKRPAPLLWGLRPGVGEAIAEWVGAAPQAKGQAAIAAAHHWVADSAGRGTDLVFALECVAWAQDLPELAGKLGADAWWALVETLTRIVEEVSATAAPDPAEAEATVVAQLLGGELPLLLGRLLPELRPLCELTEASKRALSDGIDRLTDGEGLLTAALWIDDEIPAASLLLACWTRCRALGGEAKPWNSGAQTQYDWLVRQTLRLSDRHGRPAFAPADLIGARELLGEALGFGADGSDEAAAALRLKGFRADESFETPEPSNHSEWSELGVLAAGWRDKAPRIVVAHPADVMKVEVYAGKQLLLAGEWPVEATINNETVRSTDDWECQCWHSDEDGDYLELALPLAGGARLERQFFVAREDGVAFLAETLFSGSQDSADLTITSRIPLGGEVGMRPEKETREAVLTAGGETLAGVVPLALAEWRDDPRGGELTAADKRLVLTRQHQGRNAASFLWIDFSASRFDKQRTWRQLTVAENLKKVSPDVAIGYRVQAAKHQWFLYRSLDNPGNRTLMGQNLSSEMLVGKFQAPSGNVKEYFEIEGTEE